MFNKKGIAKSTMLDVSDIHQIEVIAELGSISKAAEQLNVSQPTLSKRISRLEQVLNVTLFHRDSSGMLPTEAASHIIRAGSSLKAQINSIERHIELMNTLKTGELRLGVGPIMEQLFFPDVLLKFSRKADKIRISVRTEASQDLLTLLQEGSVDVIAGPFDEQTVPEGLNITPVVTEDVVCVVRRNHPLTLDSGDIQLPELLRYPAIGPRIPRSMMSKNLEYRKTFKPIITCENYATSKSMVMNSDYVTGGPESLFKQELQSGELVKLPFKTHMRWTASCVTRPETVHVPIVREIISIFVASVTSQG